MTKTSKTIIIGSLLTLITLYLCLLFSEWYLKKVYNLGNPVLYQDNPFYGYRPIPNQQIKRFHGATITFNNLGLRTTKDWDNHPENKLLFLGDSVTYGGSYITDQDLFTSIVDKQFPQVDVGNGGVNAWGVANIYGLVVESDFQPATHYVFVLIEADFYRTLSRGFGWRSKPSSALQEVLVHFLEIIVNKTKYSHQPTEEDRHQSRAQMRKSVTLLKEITQEIEAKGGTYSIIISPDKEQALGIKSKDTLLETELKKEALPAFYLLDTAEISTLEKETVETIYHDHVHLSKEGHNLWGTIISDYLNSRFF